MEILRGDIFYITSLLPDKDGGLSRRPAVVVSNDFNNRWSDHLQVVYLSKKERKSLPTHVRIEGKLTFDNKANEDMCKGVILCEHLTRASKDRIFGERVARVTPTKMREVDAAICRQLGLPYKEDKPQTKRNDNRRNSPYQRPTKRSYPY